MIAQENGFIPVVEIAEATEETTPAAEQAEQREEAPVQPAQSQPGFELILALVSLLAVSYLATGRKD
ncbi:MAG: PGF-CTERM sorting domain-containing protein [Methanotrichaceae archaeon]|nr:PGF-CTERM sorting domain-containing protein [Methanotrichaceae archaeon]